jgi:hypothetical protein
MLYRVLRMGMNNFFQENNGAVNESDSVQNCKNTIGTVSVQVEEADLSPGEVSLVPGLLLVLVEWRGGLPQGDAELAGPQRVGLETKGRQ